MGAFFVGLFNRPHSVSAAARAARVSTPHLETVAPVIVLVDQTLFSPYKKHFSHLYGESCDMDYIPLSDNASRQYIDSVTLFEEAARAAVQAQQYKGGMYWKVEGAYEYLVKTQPDNRQTRLGKRSPKQEQIYTDFTTRKQASEDRLKSLKAALVEAERMNKALRVGRTPSIVIALLRALADARLHHHFVVVGTHALDAYEAAADVRIAQGALATKDVDLLWDARKRVQFMTTMAKQSDSILAVLQRADKTFRRKEMRLETAINDNGFEVDFLRHQPVDDDPHPFRFSDDENDLWPIQAERAAVLTQAPVFEQVVVAATGQMTVMRTIAPESFVAFKLWMAEHASRRDAAKRRRDKRQAEIVQRLISDGLLVSTA